MSHSDVLRQSHQAPGLWAAATPCWGQQRSSPASYRARGCLVTTFIWEMPLKAEHVHAANWSQAAPPHETLSCGVVSTVLSFGTLWLVLRCQFSKLTNCRAFWVEKQKLFHHKDQCPGNCSCPTWPWKIQCWDSALVIDMLTVTWARVGLDDHSRSLPTILFYSILIYSVSIIFFLLYQAMKDLKCTTIQSSYFWFIWHA